MICASVIIAHDIKRGNALLKRCVDSIEKDQGYEIIVESEGNVSEARNKAIERSSGTFLVFFDDDVVLRPNCIQELLLPFLDDSVGVVGGVNICFDGLPFREKVAASLWSSSLAMGRSSSRYTPRGNIRESDEGELLSCVMAIRREAFLKTDGFPTNLIPCEENVLVNEIQALGYKIIYNPFAVVYHNRPPIFMPYFKKIFHYGVGRGLMLEQGRGKMGMLWKPKKEWLCYPFVFIGHFVCYIFGVLKGYLS